MKVVIVNQHLQDALGGSEIQCDIIARELLKLGHQVVYLACNGNRINGYYAPYKVKPVKLSGKDIARSAINEKPDVVYWRMNKSCGFRNAVIRLRNNKIPVVFAVSSPNDTKKWIAFEKKPGGKSLPKHFFGNILRLARSIYNYTGFKWVNGVVVNNADHLNKLNIVPEIYIPNSNIKEKKDFQWNKPFICWIANLKPQKRPELCLEVAKRIGPNYDVLMVGAIQDKNYNWILDKANIPENLVYLGQKTVKEVNGIISSSACLIHTCRPEGFPGNFIQAWLQGKPIVSFEFDPGGLIRSEKLGFVSRKNLKIFVSDIKNLINDNDLNRSIGERALNYSHKTFNPDKNVKMLQDFLFEIIYNFNSNKNRY